MDEPVRGPARVGVLPFDGRQAGVLGSKDDFGDVARTSTEFVNIESVQELDEAVLPLRSQAKRRRKKLGATPAKASDEAQCDLNPKFERIIGRKQNGRPCTGLTARQTDMEFARAVDHHKLTSLGVRALGEQRSKARRIKRSQVVKPVWRRLEDQRSWRQFR